MDEKMIKRINELAKKKKSEGLSANEAAEQKALYRSYIDEFKNDLRAQLENIDIKAPDGSVTPLSSFRKNQGS